METAPATPAPTDPRPTTQRGIDRAQQCLWYAFGRFDQARISIPDSVMPWAWEMGRLADDYTEGRSSHLPSIMDMFKSRYDGTM